MPPSEVTSGVQDQAILFVLRLAQALHSSGYAAHSLEDILRHVCDQLGLIGQFFTTPTAIMATQPSVWKKALQKPARSCGACPGSGSISRP